MIEAQVASGLSIEKFAQREGINAERVYRWKRKLKLIASTSPAFVEVRPVHVVGKEHQIEVALRSGHRVFFADSVEPSVLCRLLQALE